MLSDGDCSPLILKHPCHKYLRQWKGRLIWLGSNHTYSADPQSYAACRREGGHQSQVRQVHPSVHGQGMI